MLTSYAIIKPLGYTVLPYRMVTLPSRNRSTRSEELGKERRREAGHGGPLGGRSDLVFCARASPIVQLRFDYGDLVHVVP